MRMKPVALLALAALAVLVAIGFVAWVNPDAAATVMNRAAFCG
jgi:hypothetical protein